MLNNTTDHYLKMFSSYYTKSINTSKKRQLFVVGIASCIVLILLTFGSFPTFHGGLLLPISGSGDDEDPIAKTDLGIPPDESEQLEEEPDPDAPGAIPPPKEVPGMSPTNFDDTNPKYRTFRKNTGVHLITTFFVGTYHQKRLNELLETLKRNIENPYFEAVHVLWEDKNPRYNFTNPSSRFFIPGNISDKLVTMKVNNQPTYRKFFDYANTFLARGAITIISNSDIYFDTSIKRLVFGRPGNNNNNSTTTKWRSAMALSRRHAPECGGKYDWKGTFDLCDHYIGSHDAFVFAPPVPKFVLDNSKHTQNHFGAENVIVWAFMWAKDFRGHVLNPCQRIRGFHLHCSPERHYEIGKFISRGRHGVSYLVLSRDIQY
jgi:hypothetical protein